MLVRSYEALVCLVHVGLLSLLSHLHTHTHFLAFSHPSLPHILNPSLLSNPSFLPSLTSSHSSYLSLSLSHTLTPSHPHILTPLPSSPLPPSRAGVLEEGDDVLVNVNMVDNEKAKKNVEAKKGKPLYNPFEEEEEEEFGEVRIKTEGQNLVGNLSFY